MRTKPAILLLYPDSYIKEHPRRIRLAPLENFSAPRIGALAAGKLESPLCAKFIGLLQQTRIAAFCAIRPLPALRGKVSHPPIPAGRRWKQTTHCGFSIRSATVSWRLYEYIGSRLRNVRSAAIGGPSAGGSAFDAASAAFFPKTAALFAENRRKPAFPALAGANR
jgi:hypothetical protein